jgi:hypothetical protein
MANSKLICPRSSFVPLAFIFGLPIITNENNLFSGALKVYFDEWKSSVDAMNMQEARGSINRQVNSELEHSNEPLYVL